jgi:hypothetical protein
MKKSNMENSGKNMFYIEKMIIFAVGIIKK